MHVVRGECGPQRVDELAAVQADVQIDVGRGLEQPVEMLVQEDETAIVEP